MAKIGLGFWRLKYGTQFKCFVTCSELDTETMIGAAARTLEPLWDRPSGRRRIRPRTVAVQ